MLSAQALVSPTQLLDDSVLVLAVWRSVIIARWREVPTVQHMQQVRRAVRGVVNRVGEFAAINLVEAQKSSALAEDVRTEVAATQREFEGQQRALATVIRGTGFWAATVRSVAVGLALMSRTKFPQRVFDRSDDAADWVAPLLAGLGVAEAPALRGALDAVSAWR